MEQTQVYIATVLLERNRWTPEKKPSFQVSEWIERFADAGFDGIELWENHAALATPDEMARLKMSPLPIAIFNTYARFDSPGHPSQSVATRFISDLQVPRVKFNVGADPSRHSDYLNNVVAWYETLPAGTRLLCECHPGTVLEAPEAAARAFAFWETAGVKVEAIIHLFNLDPPQLREWIRYLGAAIGHVHVQTHRAGKMRSLSTDPNRVSENVKIMQDAGFMGTYSIEFTEGVRSRDEEMESLFVSACHDLRILRSALTEKS